MKRSKEQMLIKSLLVLSVILPLAGTAGAGKNKDKEQDFDKVDYLFGPSARQSHDRVTGETASGRLHFDGAAKSLSFVSQSGPTLEIPYDKIRKLERENESHARTGSWAVGAGAGKLFIRSHKHFLLIHYTDDKNNNRSALLQLDKGNYKDILKMAEKETGLKIEK